MPKERPYPILEGMKYLGVKLKIQRKELSELTGISIAMLNRYENGFSNLDVHKAKKIADALKCTINELL